MSLIGQWISTYRDHEWGNTNTSSESKVMEGRFGGERPIVLAISSKHSHVTTSFGCFSELFGDIEFNSGFVFLRFFSHRRMLSHVRIEGIGVFLRFSHRKAKSHQSCK